MKQAKYTSIHKLILQEINLNKKKKHVLIRILQELSPNLPNYKEIITQILMNYPMAFEFIPNDMKQDIRILEDVLIRDRRILQFISNRESILALLKRFHSPSTFEYLPKELEKDDEIALKIIAQMGFNTKSELKQSDNFRKDKGLLEIYRNHWYFIKFADESLRNDREVMSHLIRKRPKSYRYASEELKRDEEIILMALNRNQSVFNYLPEELKNNREFTLKIAKTIGKCFEYYNNEYKHDREIVIATIEKCGFLYDIIPKQFKKDREIALKAFGNNYNFALHKFLFRNLAPNLKYDRIFALNIVEKFGYGLFHLDKSFRSDREIVLRAVKSFWHSLSIASDQLLQDFEIVLSACKNCLGRHQFPALKFSTISNFKLRKQIQDEAKKKYYWFPEHRTFEDSFHYYTYSPYRFTRKQ